MKEFIVHNTPMSPISEAYRGIRTNMQFANVDRDYKSVLFTSSTAGEGKTTTLCNVAGTLADIGQKVVILDCDLRKPRIHKFFNISNHFGLTDVLLNEADYKEAIQQTQHKGIWVIPSGKIPTNPSEVLSSGAMKRFVECLKADFDYVLIDTPPVVPVTDALIMSTYIDRVMLVCASGELERELAIKAKDSLDKVGAKILGVVLNKVAMNHNKYQNYYYYHNDERKKK